MTISTTGPHIPKRRRRLQEPSSPPPPSERVIPTDTAATKPVLKTQPPEEAIGTATSQQSLSPGQPLEWSGFAMTMEGAVSKEILTDWRYDC